MSAAREVAAAPELHAVVDQAVRHLYQLFRERPEGTVGFRRLYVFGEAIQPGQHADHIAVQDWPRLVEREAADGTGRVAPDTGERGDLGERNDGMHGREPHAPALHRSLDGDTPQTLEVPISAIGVPPHDRPIGDEGSDVIDGDGTLSGEQRITNAFWQEMIEESRQRRLSNSPGRPSYSNGKRKRRSSKSPVGSTTGSHGGSSRSKASSRYSTRSNRSNQSRFSRGTPRMSAEYAATLSRQQSETNQSNDLPPSLSSSRNGLVNAINFRDGTQNLEEDGACLGSSCAVGSTLIVLGCLLVTVGVLRLLISYWHEYGTSVWAGVTVHSVYFIFNNYCAYQTQSTRDDDGKKISP